MFEAGDLYIGEGDIPIKHRGVQFNYEVVLAYNNNAKTFTVRYRNRMITVAGVKWEPDSSGDSDELLDYFTFEQIKEGLLKLYCMALGRMMQHARTNIVIANEGRAGGEEEED